MARVLDLVLLECRVWVRYIVLTGEEAERDEEKEKECIGCAGSVG